MTGSWTPFSQVERFLDWLGAVGVARYDLAVSWRSNNGRYVPGMQDTDRAGVMRSLPWLRHMNSRGADIYIRAARGYDWQLVMLDDVPVRTGRGIAAKYAAAVVQTSPGSCHVWLWVSRALSEAQRKAVQAYLAQKVGADPASVSGEHNGRLPGFRNCKPRRDCWVNLLLTSLGTAFDPAPALAQGANACSSSAGEGIQARARRTKPSDGNRNESRMEFGWLLGALRSGMPQATAMQRLIEHATPRRGTDAVRYAEQSMRNAQRVLAR